MQFMFFSFSPIMVMCFLVLFFVVSAFFPTNAFTSNDLADKLLSDLNNLVSTKKLEYLNIPGFSNVLEILATSPDGKLKLDCAPGSVGPFSSIQRAGKVTLTKVSKPVSKFDIEISKMNFLFKSCNIRSLKNSQITAVEGKIGPSLASVQISLDNSQDKCIVTVDNVDVYKLGPISINTGKGYFKIVISKLSNWLENHLNVIIKSFMQLKLEDLLRRVIPKVDLCKRVPGGIVR